MGRCGAKMSEKEINPICDDDYTLHIRYPDGHIEVRENICLIHVKHRKVYDLEHGGRPVFLRIVPEVNGELWEYLGLYWKLHPLHKGEIVNG